MVATLTPEIERELEGTPELALMRRQQHDPRYPKPDKADIEELYQRLKPDFDLLHNLMGENRDVRYMRDETPKKWARRLQGARRFRSRLSHNETMRVAAMMTRNAPKVRVPQSGKYSADEKRGDKQSRWSNNLLPALERRSSRPLIRRFCDALCGDGMGVFEFYLTDNPVYDNLDTTPRDIPDPKTGEMRQETPKEVLDRTESDLMGAPLPFGLRTVDPLAVFYEEDEDGICAALIVEQKPYRQVYNTLKRKSAEQQQKYYLPRPGTNGWPVDSTSFTETWFSQELSGGSETNAQNSVLTMRYYDREWYSYIVGGIAVDGPRRHGLPGMPIFVTLGMVTSSSNKHEMVQGVTWGMKDMELTVNDLMTLELDVRYTTSRHRPVIETDSTGRAMETKNGKPAVLDLSGDAVPYLAPGQHIVDAFANFKPQGNHEMVNAILGLYQRSGLNPIAQGESPGADPAGYTVNSLTQAAQSQYEILLDNFARTLGNIVDFARLTVRDTIREKVYLSVPMADNKQGGTEWLALGPDDVDETPSIVVIDPLSDANRISVRQSLEQGNKEGFVSHRRVQSEGYNIDDPDAEDDDIAVDAAVNDLLQAAIEEAKATIYGRQAPPSGLVGPDGNPLPPSGGGQQPTANGAQPAQPQAPTVGAGNAAASQFGAQPGPARQSAVSAQAGQARGMAATGGGQ